MEKEMIKDFEFAIANLRHAYGNLVSGTVKDQKGFAQGLLGPSIKELEKILKALQDEEYRDQTTKKTTI